MKLPLLKPKQKMRATATARRAQPRDFEEEEEPTMKLSSAFVVVLLLHLVAVGGIYAFNSVKAHRPPVVEATEKPVATVVQKAAPLPENPVAPAMASALVHAPVKAVEPVRTNVIQKPVVAPAPVPVAAKESVRDSGTTYTVAKGDNPERIAKKLHVAYSELIKLNRIEDPTKLQIGQKLHVPAKLRASN